MAPVQKRFTIALAGSTSSSGTGSRASALLLGAILSRPRNEALRAASSLTSRAYSR